MDGGQAHWEERELGQITEVTVIGWVKKSGLHLVDNGKQLKDYN